MQVDMGDKMSLIKSILIWLGLADRPENKRFLPVYMAIVTQARQPFLFGKAAAPDTFDGRFDVLVLHIYLVLRRLKHEDMARIGAGQVIFDLFFRDMDRALREMGVGDLSVSKKIKKMVEAFYGRIKAYDDALAEGAKEDMLTGVIVRNFYPDKTSTKVFPIGTAFANYMRAMDSYLHARSINEILSRDIFVHFEERLT